MFDVISSEVTLILNSISLLRPFYTKIRAGLPHLPHMPQLPHLPQLPYKPQLPHLPHMLHEPFWVIYKPLWVMLCSITLLW